MTLPCGALVSEVGYRYNAKFGLLVKATVGLIGFRGESFSDSWVLPWPGVSLGWSF